MEPKGTMRFDMRLLRRVPSLDRILEDNDPSGYKSNKGIAAKETSNLKVFEIPPRSPDLNICDYALWSQINRKMRRGEASFPMSKKESRDEYLERLKRNAKSLSRSFINRAIEDMKRRCQRLYAARGGHFEEGARRARF